MGSRVLVTLLLILFVAIVIKYLYIYYSGTKLFYPKKEYDEMPDLPGSEVTLPTGAVGMHYIVSPDAKTILYCHGNAGNISYWKYMVELIYHSGVNVFIFDYRGFGKSPGFPILTSMVEDTFAAYEYLRKTVRPEDMVLLGESMGGHLALQVATQREIGCLALVATFSNTDAVAEYLKLPYHQKLIAKIQPIDNIRLVRKIKVPTVILHSIEDDVIGPNCADLLFIECGADCKDQIWINGSHSRPIITKEKLEWLFEFCEIEKPRKNVNRFLKNICRDTRKVCPFGKNEQTPPPSSPS